MRAAGLEVDQDAAGNVRGRREGSTPGLPALLLGSHLDTVPDAGAYDGMLGVLMAVAVAERLRATPLPFALEVIGFSDEEGARFGKALLGSQAVAGHWDEAWWDLRDRDDVSLREAFEAFGLDPRRVGEAARRPEEPGRLPRGAHRAGPLPGGGRRLARLRHHHRGRTPVPPDGDRRGAARRRDAVRAPEGRAARRRRDGGGRRTARPRGRHHRHRRPDRRAAGRGQRDRRAGRA
ncbi:M20/M25/M40 family metallo-hydrolase [Nocardioides convexus]|uniref:M20/M25/M40 family metallo-hydrolase n=1 Tax=Nocardioides convexus TaxID=2712224 RepID=UPI0024189A0D|nr:M20/M25/M40 family metallo-hydrolase [Nocardioides convexus]